MAKEGVGESLGLGQGIRGGRGTTRLPRSGRRLNIRVVPPPPPRMCDITPSNGQCSVCACVGWGREMGPWSPWDIQGGISIFTAVRSTVVEIEGGRQAHNLKKHPLGLKFEDSSFQKKKKRYSHVRARGQSPNLWGLRLQTEGYKNLLEQDWQQVGGQAGQS